MHMLRCRNASWILMALVACGQPAAADTTTTVRNVSGITVISSGVALVRLGAVRHHVRAPLRNVVHRSIDALAYAPPARSPDSSPGAARLVQTALGLLGAPYAWGGASPRGFDCSGFTSYVYRRFGIAIPRTADVQFAAGRPVREPSPGDLVFFQTYDYGASHVGIYLGDGRFVNSIGSNVHVTTFASEYFRSRYLGARRFLPG